MNRRNFLGFAAGLPALALFPWSATTVKTKFVPGDILTSSSLNSLARLYGEKPKFVDGGELSADDLNRLAVASGGIPGFKPFSQLKAADINRMLPRLVTAERILV